MSLKIKVINRKTGKELEMEQSAAQKLNRLVKIPTPTESIKVPNEYKKKSKEVLAENIETENVEKE